MKTINVLGGKVTLSGDVVPAKNALGRQQTNKCPVCGKFVGKNKVYCPVCTEREFPENLP